jgi:CheY-like chemotaxis protein
MLEDPNLQRRKVLVVEDSGLIAYEIEAAVTALGCTVLGPVASVDGAMRLLRRLPDTALLDVQLEPGTAAPIAEMLRAAGVPYAAVTGYDRRDLVAPVWQGVPYLGKPFTIEQVQALVRELLPAAG